MLRSFNSMCVEERRDNYEMSLEVLFDGQSERRDHVSSFAFTPLRPQCSIPPQGLWVTQIMTRVQEVRSYEDHISLQWDLIARQRALKFSYQ